MASGPATEVGRRFRPLLVGGAALALAGVAAAVVWLRPRPNAAPTADAPASQAAQDQLGAISDMVVIGKLELARTDFENRDYAAAIAGAREALQAGRQNAEAKALIAQAERAQRELDAAVAEARAAVGRGDTGRATAALGQVLQLDPRHPVADELKASLNQAFRQQADEARRLSVEARAAADKARATSLPDYAAARTLATQADASFGREDYTGAAQKFFAARNGFEAARRAADAARVVAADARARCAAAPTPRPTAAAYATAPPPTTAPPSAAPAQPQPTYVPPPSAAPVPQPTIASNPVSTPSLPAPATSQPDAGDAAVRRVLADYERAIEGKDINLFRSLMPGLSADAEKRLREAFGAVKSQDVGIAVDSVLVEGDRATVRVHRQDTISGRKMAATQQTFRLARSGGVWQIVSIGQ